MNLKQTDVLTHGISATTAEPLALLVGMDATDLPVRKSAFTDVRTETLPYALIHAVLASAPWADFVISPLVSEQFDAFDLATELMRGGYRGTYLVVIPRLPRPEIIRRELAQLCPGLKVDLIHQAPH